MFWVILTVAWLALSFVASVLIGKYIAHVSLSYDNEQLPF